MLSRFASACRLAVRSTSCGGGHSRIASFVSREQRGLSSTSSQSFALPTLSYEYDALEPHLDAATMEIHHKRHHQTYISNLNGLLTGAAAKELGGSSLADIQKKVASLPDAVRTPVVNSGGGHYNHTLWWSILRADAPRAPPPELRSMIDADFGDLDAMKKEFQEAATKRFGSGWAWLSVGSDGKLFVSSTANQENPLMDGIVDKPGTPILGLDVWEHAYYLKYQNRRPEFIKAFWNVVDWEQVAKSFESAQNGGTAIFDVPLEQAD